MNEDNGTQGQEQAGWTYTPGTTSSFAPGASNEAPSQVASNESRVFVEWTASEYIANHKDVSWFSMLAAGAVALSVIIYFITTDVISVVMIVVLAIIVGVFAARQPQVLPYKLNSDGLHIGHRFYMYGNFKSFSVVNEGAFNHISLLPLKRFMPPIAMHYPPENEDQIIKVLLDYLPFEEHKGDIIDSISRKVRF